MFHGKPEILVSHFPLLCKVVSQRYMDTPEVRLIRLQRDAEERIAAALELPRISILGLKDHVPNSSQLLTYVREYVPILDIPWLDHAEQGAFEPTRMKDPT